MKRSWIILTLPLLMLVAGCKTVEYQELNGVSMLTGHPQFPIAATNAPAFTRSALREVARLNHIIRSK